MDGGMCGYRRPDAGHAWRVAVQFARRSLPRATFYRARLVWLFPEPLQSDAGRDARWRADRDCIVALALAAGIRVATLVRVEVSELYCLADRASVAAPDLFVVPQTNRRSATLFRSHAIAALDDVGIIFRFDCRADLRDARRAAGFEQARRPRSRPQTGYAGAVDECNS